MTVNLRGVIPIVVTPFAAGGSVDLAQFDRQIEFLRTRGVRWVGFGFGSEVQKLSPDELSAMMARAVAGGDGELRVIGNAELTSAEAGAAAIRRAAAAGAEAVLVRPSGLGGMPADAVIEAIAAAVPVVVQDAPQNTGVTLSAAALAELMADVDEVVAVKIEPASPVPFPSGTHADRTGTILGGLGGLHFPYELDRGAVGTMPGPAIPELFQAVQRYHDTGEEVRAFELWARALPLIVLSLRDPDTFLTVQKYLLTQRGVLAGHALRRPHGDLDPDLLAEVDATVERIKLWDLLDECAPG